MLLMYFHHGIARLYSPASTEYGDTIFSKWGEMAEGAAVLPIELIGIVALRVISATKTTCESYCRSDQFDNCQCPSV
jgi:hypothetical protein